MTMERMKDQNTLSVYRTLPAGCIAHPVTNEYSAPFVMPGEWVVVDTTDRSPRVGELYVIQWENGSRILCQARHSSSIWQTEGEDPRWNVGSLQTANLEDFDAWLRQTRARCGHDRIPVWSKTWADGPFRQEYLARKLVGSVIGIYQPEFEEPRRPPDIDRLAEQVKVELENVTGAKCRTQIDTKLGFVFVTICTPVKREGL
jgi:hypothetical protein